MPEIYLVGGAVRDQLLKRPVHERDWVVVGETPESMIQQGFKPVGKDFPVFLHPDTKEEYALARTERKTGPGYKGFQFYAEPSVTLTDDLKRRDLTINAIAQDGHGALIDPYGGYNDIQHKILRHVSEAFREDPVRILRLARFAARFPDFLIAPETIELAKTMKASGEVAHLVAERVWQELSRALSETAPERFFETLNNVGALPILIPEWIESLDHRIKQLKAMAQHTDDIMMRFAAMNYTTADLKTLSNRLRIPNEIATFAQLTQKNVIDDFKQSITAERVMDIFKQTDALRRSERFHKACDFWYQLQLLSKSYMDFLLNALKSIQAINISELIKTTSSDIPNIIYQARLHEIKRLLK